MAKPAWLWCLSASDMHSTSNVVASSARPGLAKGLRWTSFFVVLITMAALAYYWYARVWGSVSATPKTMAAATVHPLERETGNVVTTSGTVRLRTGAVVRVGSQVSGIIQRLNVTVGSKVVRGGIIAMIDPTAQLARLSQARAQLEIDSVARDKAIRDLERVQKLADSGLIAKQQVEDLRWAAQLANARVEKSLTDIKAAEVDYSYTTIRAPVAGTISSVSTQQGETVAASFAAPTFVTIVDDTALELVAMVDETDIAGVAAGQAVRFSVEAYPGKDYLAVVRRIDPTATIISGVINYAVIAEITEGVSELKPDMTANIVITRASRKALFLPQNAVYQIGDNHFVDLDGGTIPQRRMVAVGSKDAEQVEITSGIDLRDTVRTPASPTSRKEERQ